MKSLASFVVASLVATCVSAGPVFKRAYNVGNFGGHGYDNGQGNVGDSSNGIQAYRLVVSTNGDASLNGKNVSLSDSAVGVYPGAAPLEFYTVADPTNQALISIHTLPIGIIDHVLALVGTSGLSSFEDVAEININSANDDTTFAFDGTLLTNDGPGRWLAFPAGTNSWNIKWDDGNAITTQNYIPVELVYHKVQSVSPLQS